MCFQPKRLKLEKFSLLNLATSMILIDFFATWFNLPTGQGGDSTEI